MSSEDTKTLDARSIIILASSGKTAGVFFALGTNARVQTYALPTLAPLPGAAATAGSSSIATSGGGTLLQLTSGNMGGWACTFDGATAASEPRVEDVGQVDLKGEVEPK